jgi:hypothetical protein
MHQKIIYRIITRLISTTSYKTIYINNDSNGKGSFQFSVDEKIGVNMMKMAVMQLHKLF